jgi:hypothetical protein
MRTVVYTGDRRRELVQADRHILRVTTGALRHRRTDPVDLRPAYFTAFGAWLGAGAKGGRAHAEAAR